MQSARSTRPPRFSIITPLYNHAAFLPDAVESVLKQTFSDFEMIVVDDGSTDDSPAILDRYAAADPRIIAIHQPNAGAANARNAAISAARGGWIAFLDSDDIWNETALEHYNAYIAAHPEARLLYGYWHRLVNGRFQQLAPRHQDAPAAFADLFAHVFIGSSCVCIQRTLLDEIGLFDPALPPVEDYDLFLRAALRTTLHPINHATGLRRRHETNISKGSGKGRLKQAQLLERYSQDPRAAALLRPDMVSRRLAHEFYAAGKLYLRDRDPTAAIGALRASLRYRNSLKTHALLVLASIRRQIGPRT